MFWQKTQPQKIHDAQQNFFRAVHKIWDVMPLEEGRDFMVSVADPETVTDWETGALISDPCPKHNKPFFGFTATSPLRMLCEDCE